MIRTHGDLHLGQTMLGDRGWVVLDFEGEPARPLPERRLKRSPLRDVAGMLRSFSYVTAGARSCCAASTRPRAGRSARGSASSRATTTAVDGSLLPPGQQATEQLLAVFETEKAVYELRYELNNRPDWVAIPVAGIVRLLDAAIGTFHRFAAAGRGHTVRRHEQGTPRVCADWAAATGGPARWRAPTRSSS